MKGSLILIAVITVLLMIGGYSARGYLAAGPEIAVTPLLCLAVYIVWDEEQKQKAKIARRRG